MINYTLGAYQKQRVNRGFLIVPQANGLYAQYDQNLSGCFHGLQYSKSINSCICNDLMRLNFT